MPVNGSKRAKLDVLDRSLINFVDESNASLEYQFKAMYKRVYIALTLYSLDIQTLRKQTKNINKPVKKLAFTALLGCFSMQNINHSVAKAPKQDCFSEVYT